MSYVIRLPQVLYQRLAKYAVGFDTPVQTIERIINKLEGIDAEPKKEIPSKEGILKIDLIPSDTKIFKEKLLISQHAIIIEYYEDGRVSLPIEWKARNISEKSNIIGNIRSRPDYRQGAWQEKGIKRLSVEVPEENNFLNDKATTKDESDFTQYEKINSSQEEYQEIERVERKLKLWTENPNQINARILTAYLKLEQSNTNYFAVTEEQLNQLYPLAKSVYEEKILIKDAINILASKYNMNTASATIYMYNFQHIMKGERYTRSMSSDITENYFNNITKDYGYGDLNVALSALKQHIEYLQSQKNNPPCHSLLRIYNAFKATVK